MQVLRIFVSSPGDVGPERQFSAQVIQRLQGEFAAHLKLEPYFWEHEAMFSNRGDYQENIPAPGDFDIFVCLLWSRMGSRLHSRHHRSENGETFPTGTRYEFDNALAAARRSRTPARPFGTPDMLVFVKRAQPEIALDPREQRAEKLRQYDELTDFVRQVQIDEREGTFTVATTGFDHLGDFQVKLEKGLRKVLAERLAGAADLPARAPATWTMGSPFLGLYHYEVKHAPIFFGRAAATDAVLSQLRVNEAAGRAFVLIFGGSGLGKSSLARAGVLALLQTPGVISGVDLWRHAILQPREGGETGGDLFRALARNLLRPEALPELASDGSTEEWIARELRQSSGGVGLLKGGLSQAARDFQALRGPGGRQPVARLAVLVDQLEELFTQEWISKDEREKFAAALAALARSGLVWVIGTLRSDFFHQCEALPELMTLKEGSGQYHLQPPTEAEVAQIIRWPAVAAGLSFEENIATGERLDDLLRDDALGSRDSLPLLSFALDHLYETCNDHGQLSLAEYRRTGRLEGALCQQADAAYAKLESVWPGQAWEAFTAVMRRLTVNPTGDGAFNRAWAEKSACERTDAQRALVAGFIEARLLVADEVPGRGASITLAHEALIRAWPKLADWLERRRGFFRSVGRLNAELSLWQESRESDEYLLEGRRLADASGLLEESRAELDPAQVGFIERSRVRAEAGARRRLRRLRRVAAGFGALALVAGLCAVLAWRARGEAQRRRQQVQRVLASSDFSRGQELFDAGDAPGGLVYLARAIDTDPPHAAVAAERLSHALTQRAWPLAVSAPIRHGDTVSTAAFSPDGSRVVTAGRDGMTLFWDSRSGQPAGEPLRQTKPVRCAAFTPDGKRVLTGCFDGAIRLWETATGQVVAGWEKNAQGDEINCAAVDPQGRWAATGARDGSVAVWELSSGRKLVELAHPENVHVVEFSPGRTPLLLTVSAQTLRVWTLPDGKTVLEARHDGDIRSARFGPDGRRIVSASDDKAVRVWDVGNDDRSFTLARKIPHEAEVRDACFNADGSALATIGGNGARLWKADGSPLVDGVLAHRDAVTSVRFSPGGERLITGSRDGEARIWAARTGERIGEPIRANGAILTAAFHPDGRRVLVALADGETRVWQAPPFLPGADVLPQDGPVSGLTASKDGRWLGVVTANGGASLCDLAAQPPRARLLAPPASVLSMAFSGDGRFLATGAVDSNARLWTLATPDAPPMILPGGGVVNAVAFSPDSRLLATTTETGAAQCWNLPGGQPCGKPLFHPERITAVSFNRDGTLLLTAAGDGLARVWRTATGEPAFPPLRGEAGTDLTCAACSPAAGVAAVGTRSGAVRWWDLETGRALREPSRHHGAVLALAFSPYGRRLATASEDATAVVWDAATGQPVCDALRHAAAVTAVAFTPDARRVATATEDGRVRLWDAESGQALTEPMGDTRGRSVHGLAFGAGGDTLFAGTEDHQVQCWDVTAPPAPNAASLARFARALAAVRLQDSGRLEPQPALTRDALRTMAQNLQPALDGKWLEWFFADPLQRALNPHAARTVPALLAQRLDENTPAALDEAGLLANGDPVTLARVARQRTEHR